MNRYRKIEPLYDADGRLHFTGLKPGDLAETVLLPGDPLRAKFIAETFLEDPKQYNEIRGMLGFTGTYKGVPVSVQGTGMGMPSMGIYSWELITEYGCQNLIRIGTAGSFLPLLLRTGFSSTRFCTFSFALLRREST